MPAVIKVALVGATGRTGKSIVDGLLASETNFDIVVLARPAAINGEAYNQLRSRSVHVVAADLRGPKEDLVSILKGVDVVISTIIYTNLDDQIPLAEAAKEAGVKRFVPSEFSTPATRGVLDLHDKKDNVLAAIQRLYLPYTVIDVGWWSEHSVPAVASGRTDHAVSRFFNTVPGDGTVPVAYTDAPDIGLYVAKIITDPRTINKKVLAYTEVLNANQVSKLMEELSGEAVIRNHLSADEIHSSLASARSTLGKDPADPSALMTLALYQYINSWGLRGDGNPESAAYLGYLDFKQLYPEVIGKTMRTIFQEILDGRGK
ncbi:hypothetical protein M426DRAFT_15375 [Hypoxylon sp. CI-4A]|nr:hypothetical protein M426DRAFT_15375 [Hypoxylon sp. CI-4A]